jgi:hypothetical protein
VVWSLPGEGGSVSPEGTFVVGHGNGSNRPGAWIKEVVDGVLTTTLVPTKGLVQDLLKPAVAVVEDPNVALCRMANPDDS